MGTKLEFKHFVVDRQGLIFASARDGSERIYNFLVNPENDVVLEQSNHHFREIGGTWASYIRKEVASFKNILPTYRINCFDIS